MRRLPPLAATGALRGRLPPWAATSALRGKLFPPAAGGALLLATMVVASTALGTPRSARAGAHAAARSHLQVTEIEYHLMLSRGVVKAGPLDLETIDAGMDSHDLRLRRYGSQQQLSAPELRSGERWDGVVSLKPGTYALWCSLPEHAKLGMHATLRVVPG